MNQIITPSLLLVASTVEIAELECLDVAKFSTALHVSPPAVWPPPPFNDADSMAYNRDRLRENPHEAGWRSWYFLLRDNNNKPTALAGVGGFKGPPDETGTVEVGYSILEQYRRKGLASEATAALCEWAFAQPGVHGVIAETLPELVASIGVLNKLGFSGPTPGSEEGVIRFELKS